MVNLRAPIAMATISDETTRWIDMSTAEQSELK